MRAFSTATAAYFARRGPILAHALIWISARNRTTGAVEKIGFWTGADHQTFLIGGESRTYYGAGAALRIDPIRLAVGVQVRTLRAELSQVADTVLQALRGYDPRHAPVEIHRALFEPETEALVDEPHILFRGTIDKAPINTPKKGDRGTVPLEIASMARALTKGLSRFRSDACLKDRASTDTFRKYATRTDTVEVPWGAKE